MERNNMYKNGIPQFDGQKYAFWSIRMKTYTQAQGFEIWQSIANGYKTPTNGRSVLRHTLLLNRKINYI
jgi:hypothetical protein